MKAAHMGSILSQLTGYNKISLECKIEKLPVSFLLSCEERNDPNDKRFGYFNLEEGFYSIVRHGYYEYDKVKTYRISGYQELLIYVRPSNNKDNFGNIRSYSITAPNFFSGEQTCDCGQYVWDTGSIFGGSNSHGKILFVRKLLPFEIIDLKFKLFQFSRRNKVTWPSHREPIPRC